MDGLQGKQGDIVADPLKVTDCTVCQVWHRLTQQTHTTIRMQCMWDYINSTANACQTIHLDLQLQSLRQTSKYAFSFHHWKLKTFMSYFLNVSHSFFQMNVTQWDFHQPVLPFLSVSITLSVFLSSRCQVQWESLCCWMPSDTFQNNDNKLHGSSFSCLYPRSSHCRHTPTDTPNDKKKKRTHTLYYYIAHEKMA